MKIIRTESLRKGLCAAAAVCLAAALAGCGCGAQNGTQGAQPENGVQETQPGNGTQGTQPESGAQTGTGIQGETESLATQSMYREDVAPADLLAAVAEELGEDYWPDMDIPAEVLADNYGITEDMYEEASAQMPMISTNVDTLILVKAKAGKEQQVEEALKAYKEFNTTEAMQYPMNVGKVHAAQIKSFGRYVCFVQLGAEIPGFGTEESEENSDEAAIRHCEQENTRALVIIEGMLKK